MLEYYHVIKGRVLYDTPVEVIHAKANGSAAVIAGFYQLWEAVHMRRIINELSQEERRSLEIELAEEMSKLDLSDAAQERRWRELHHIHHWLVTADQAEMLASGFVS